MIRFDTTKLNVEIVQLKSVTTSLGGSITVVDETKSTEAKEVTKRIIVPMAVARQFIQDTKKITKYLKPVFTAIVRYDDHIVAMERHPLAGLGELETEGLFGKKRWEPACEVNLDTLVKPMIESSDKEWYFDGRYAYSFDSGTVERAVGEADNLTRDGQFRKVATTSIDLQNLAKTEKIAPSTRSCMAFVASSGELAVSPPIWKNISDIGSSKLDKGSSDDDEDGLDDEDVEITVNNRFTFDTVNSAFNVNLNFVLKAGQEIGQAFGYEYVEPLQLSRLMVELRTVNLPNVPKQIKATYDSGLPFTHVLAWLIGMSRKADTLETYVIMRSLMKYLTKKGIFKANTFNADQVFKVGQTVVDVPLMKLEDLTKMKEQPTFSFSDVLEQVNATLKAKRKNAETVHFVGTLANEED